MANAGRGLQALLAGLGAGAQSLGGSIQHREAEDRAFQRMMQQIKARSETGGDDWSTPFEGEVNGQKGLWQYNKRTRETVPVTPGAKLQANAPLIAPDTNPPNPPTPPQITKPVAAAPKAHRQLVRNKVGVMVSVDPDTGLDHAGKSVEGYTPPREPGLVAVETPDDRGGTKLVLAPKVAGQEVPGQGSRAQASVKEKIASNRQQLSVIDDAERELEAHPDAVGLKRAAGDVPLIGGAIGDPINQRADPAGVAARASIANIASLKVHDRSGGAVTLSEYPRLAPFIPKVSDTKEAIKIKLQKLRQAVEVETQLLEQSGTSAPGVPNTPASRKLGAPKKADAAAIMKKYDLEP